MGRAGEKSPNEDNLRRGWPACLEKPEPKHASQSLFYHLSFQDVIIGGSVCRCFVC